MKEYWKMQKTSRFHLPSAFLLRQFIRANKILKAVRKLNIRKDAVFETLMDRLEENGISMVDFHCLSIEESAYLEVFFDSEILPLLSPTIVGKRQLFPFLKISDASYKKCRY